MPDRTKQIAKLRQEIKDRELVIEMLKALDSRDHWDAEVDRLYREACICGTISDDALYAYKYGEGK